jgi:hypothetical protein
VGDHPSCEAVTRDGRRCRSATSAGSAFCAYHLGLVEEFGEAALRNGDHARARSKKVVGVLVEPEPEAGLAVAETDRRGTRWCHPRRQ